MGFEVKNRLMRSATWENMATGEGEMTESLYGVYETLAKNQVGTIITGYANVVKEEQPNPGMIGIYDDKFIASYEKLTDIVHEYGSRIILQVAYGGTKTSYNVGERVIFSPSDIPERGTKTQGKAMTKEEIQYIVNAFGMAARRAKVSGFDGIEIHAAHTYLINQFLSPYYNNRTDEYGGTLANRMRFLKEIYYHMREEVGEDYPILVKLTATEFFEGGLTFEETRIICKEMEKIGIQAIELSGNVHGSAKNLIGQSYDGFVIEEEGYFYRYGAVISEEIDIPIITVGGFQQIDTMESILNNTSIEYFALSRPLLAEPDLIARWEAGSKEQAKCIRCSKCRTKEGNHCVVF